MNQHHWHDGILPHWHIGSVWFWLIVVLAVGWFVYRLTKNKKEK